MWDRFKTAVPSPIVRYLLIEGLLFGVLALARL